METLAGMHGEITNIKQLPLKQIVCKKNTVNHAIGFSYCFLVIDKLHIQYKYIIIYLYKTLPETGKLGN